MQAVVGALLCRVLKLLWLLHGCGGLKQKCCAGRCPPAGCFPRVRWRGLAWCFAGGCSARSGKGAAQGAAAAEKLLCRLGKVAGQGAVQAAVGVVKLLVTMRWGTLAKRAVLAEV